MPWTKVDPIALPLTRKLDEAAPAAINDTTAAASISAKQNHGWQNRTGTAEGSIRHEVFTRRGGLYFGIKHLLDYPADYPKPLYRFADFNAGWHASRNAAFQQAAAIASGTRLVRDGDLLVPGAPLDRPGATEAALRSIDVRLAMTREQIRADLEQGSSAAFAQTALYRSVFAIACPIVSSMANTSAMSVSYVALQR